MAKQDLKGKVVVITVASSGFGSVDQQCGRRGARTVPLENHVKVIETDLLGTL